MNTLRNQVFARQLAKIKNIKIVNNNDKLEMPMQKIAKSISKNIDNPVNPITCNGTSYQCNVAGTGTTPIKNVNLNPNGYDYLATNMQEGGRLGKSYENNTILNCRQNSICTEFTKNSLKNSFGFENFQ